MIIVLPHPPYAILLPDLPATETAGAEQVIKCIEHAFSGVQLGDGVSLREARVIEARGTDLQRERARAWDEREDWREIPEEDIADRPFALCFLDARGMAFHLPAYLCFALRNYQDITAVTIDYLLYALDRQDARFHALSAPQKAAVREFLYFMATHAGPHVDSDCARHALENVWQPESS